VIFITFSVLIQLRSRVEVAYEPVNGPKPALHSRGSPQTVDVLAAVRAGSQ
jgi:hypothetical protein